MSTPVCLSENLTVDDIGRLQLAPWAAPRPVIDTVAASTGDGPINDVTSMPGELLIDKKVDWRNDTPIRQGLLIRVTRASKDWVVSNPNAIQFRDRWTYAVDVPPPVPVTTGIYNSQCGSSIDLGTNSVAEPNTGRQWMWTDVNCADEWVAPLEPDSTFQLWYRCYRWTPPPWSDNANLDKPQHEASAHWTRIQLIAFPMRAGSVVG